MRSVNPALQAHLETGATTLCRAWVVRRADGVEFGFTDHDLDLMVDGVLCEASAGMDASAIESTTGLSVDNSQAIGALRSAGITDVDVETGKFDGSEVRQWLVNWQDPSQTILQFRGHLGEIRRGTGVFEAELRGLSEALNKPVGRAYLRQCDCIVGDAKCGFDLNTTGFFGEDVVDSFSGRRVIEASSLGGFGQGWFLNGTLRWLSGQNAGTQGLVRVDQIRGSRRVLELWEETRFPIAADDLFRVQAGCDKLAATCRTKFDNFLNFRGFPHMPGEDWSVSYPVRQGTLDGGSIQ